MHEFNSGQSGDFAAPEVSEQTLLIRDSLSNLSDNELASLEDEIDFFAFTGVPSQRMLDVLHRAGLLDNEWTALRAQRIAPRQPKVQRIMPVAPHRKAEERCRPSLDLRAQPVTA